MLLGSAVSVQSYLTLLGIPQMDILEHKEVQLKGTEKRVYSLEQQVEQLQTELSRYCSCL